MRNFSLVLACSQNGGIGLKGKLPWRIRKEMAYFAKLTTTVVDENKQNAVIMGRKTWDSIPAKYRPLPNRLNVVLTRTPTSETAKAISSHKDTIVCGSFNEAIEKLSWMPYLKSIENVFVIGGSQIYEESLRSKHLEFIYLTKIFQDFECDTFFKYEKSQFEETKLSETIASDPKTDDCAVQYQFFKLVKKTPQVSEEKSDDKQVAKVDKNHEEFQYLNLIRDIISKGVTRPDRTGTGTLSFFGTSMRFNLRGDTFPLLTTKRVFWRGVAEELLWFIRGCTSAKELSAKKVRIWDGNGSREFLDKRGLSHYEEGDLGPVYGFQWRHFGAQYKNMHADYHGLGVDQLKTVIETIKNNPYSRRIVMTAWNPSDLGKMALPPCHMFCQFYVADGELSCQMYQRSADMGLGVPFNIASYSLLTRMIAQVCALKAGDFVHVMGDTHVYLNHVKPLQEQLERNPRPFPKLKLNPNKKNIDDFVYEDFKIIGYSPHKSIRMQMAV